MKKVNNREEVIKRNRRYLNKHLGMTEKKYFRFMREFGPPRRKLSANWSEKNPTSGWCGGVTNSLRLSGKVPAGYIACRQKKNPHYYMLDPKSGKAIDLTIYQFKGNYPHNYRKYSRNFMNVLSNDVKRLMKALNFKIDRTMFQTKIGGKGQTFISSRNRGKRSVGC